MTENKIDPRGTVALITAHMNNMCNAKTTEEVNNEFLYVKEMLINLYKYKFTNVQEKV